MARLRALDPDVSVVVAYGELLAGDVLDAPRLGSVNLHFSLLPAMARREPGPARDPRRRRRHGHHRDADGRGHGHRSRAGPARGGDPVGRRRRLPRRAPREDRRRGGRGACCLGLADGHRDPDAAGRHRHAGAQARARRPDRRLDATRGRRRASCPRVRARSGREHHVQGERPQAAPRGGDRAPTTTRPGRSSASTGKGSSWRRGTGACDCSRSRRPAGAGCRPRTGHAAFAI